MIARNPYATAPRSLMEARTRARPPRTVALKNGTQVCEQPHARVFSLHKRCDRFGNLMRSLCRLCHVCPHYALCMPPPPPIFCVSQRFPLCRPNSSAGTCQTDAYPLVHALSSRLSQGDGVSATTKKSRWTVSLLRGNVSEQLEAHQRKVCGAPHGSSMRFLITSRTRCSDMALICSPHQPLPLLPSLINAAPAPRVQWTPDRFVTKQSWFHVVRNDCTS